MSFVTIDPSDFVVSADSVTAPAWGTNNPVLTQFFIPNSISSAPTFFVDVYASGSSDVTPQFSIAYGHVQGSGSVYYNPGVPGLTPSRTTYGQYRTLIYGDENVNFNFGAGNTNSPDILVINVNRSKYKEKLFLPTFNLHLSGSQQLKLTNNSNDSTNVNFLDCGRVYDIVSGSNGNAYSESISGARPGYTVSGSYGLFLPDVGLIVLNPRALALSSANGGIGLNIQTDNNVNRTNYLKLYEAISGAAEPNLNKGFQLNSEETISSNFVFVRVKNSDYNYTTNPSMISGSGELVYPTLINNPQTYMTTVGLYNDNNDLVAVAKLSKPLVKDFTKEALIRVKLNW